MQPIKTTRTAFLSALCAAALAVPAAQAQDTAPLPDGLDLGEEVGQPDQPPPPYVKDTPGDWTLRCQQVGPEQETCELNQLLEDENDNPVAQITIYRLPTGLDAPAAATIAVPLETMLTADATISVDGGRAKRYRFQYCDTQGCFARIGLVEEDLEAFRRGATATLTIVPVRAPDQKFNLPISLSGFTAGYAGIPEVPAIPAPEE